MVDRDVLARIMRAVEEVERRKGLSVPPSLNSVYASEGGGWPGVTTDDGELVRMPSRLDLDYGTKMPPMMLPSDFERVMAPIYPGFRPVHGAGDSGGNERSDDAPKASSTSSTAVGTGHDLTTVASAGGMSSDTSGAGSSASAAGFDTDETVAKGVEFIDGVLEINGDDFFRGIASDDRIYILTKVSEYEDALNKSHVTQGQYDKILESLRSMFRDPSKTGSAFESSSPLYTDDDALRDAGQQLVKSIMDGVPFDRTVSSAIAPDIDMTRIKEVGGEFEREAYELMSGKTPEHQKAIAEALTITANEILDNPMGAHATAEDVKALIELARSLPRGLVHAAKLVGGRWTHSRVARSVIFYTAILDPVIPIRETPHCTDRRRSMPCPTYQ
eukprot:jgi/Mesvir1/7598/Mv02350-RA.1